MSKDTLNEKTFIDLHADKQHCPTCLQPIMGDAAIREDAVTVKGDLVSGTSSPETLNRCREAFMEHFGERSDYSVKAEYDERWEGWQAAWNHYRGEMRESELAAAYEKALADQQAQHEEEIDALQRREIPVIDLKALREKMIQAYRLAKEDQPYVASARIDAIIEEIRPYLREPKRESGNEWLKPVLTALLNAQEIISFSEENEKDLEQLAHVLKIVRNRIEVQKGA